MVAMNAKDDRRERALSALLELSKSLGSEIDLDALLEVIVEDASAVVDAERTSIFVYDAATERLWSRVAQGLDRRTLEIDLGSGIAGDVARTRTLTNIRDAYADPRFNPSFDRSTGFRTSSILCAPVTGSDGTLLGVIQSVNKKGSDSFDDMDESLMLAIASHAGAAFERARMTELNVQAERMAQALKLASDIQMRMLPARSAGSPGLFDLQAELRPAKEVGGDLYDYFLDGEQLVFCIGDVSGKGAGAALIMAVTKTLFRANAVLIPDPAKVLAAMSSRLYEETDSSMFVTALCGRLDLATGALQFANAGHERAVVLPPAGDPAFLESKPGLPLGVFPAFTYQSLETTVPPGHTLFFLTDGVTDATAADESMFGWDRVLATLKARADSSPAHLIERMLLAVDAFSGTPEPADDITMMSIRYRP